MGFHRFTEARDDFARRPGDERLDALADLAAKSGCSRSTFIGIFGGDVDLAEHDGWHLAMVRGCTWTATKGKRTLRAATLGGIHAKVRATRKRLPAASPTAPLSDSTPPVAFEARDGEGFAAHRQVTAGLS